MGARCDTQTVSDDSGSVLVGSGNATLQLGVRLSASISVRNYLSAQHLWTARHNAELCRRREGEVFGKRPIDVQHRSYATTGVLLSVAFLEAVVNEVYEDCADGRHVGERVAPLSDASRVNLAGFWESAGNGRYPLLGKYQMALLLGGAKQFDKGMQPYQDAQLLVDLRNALVHFRPEWHDSDGDRRLSKRLAERVKPSGLLSAEDGSDWVTVKVLGAAGAEWAVATAQRFASEWSVRLGVPRLFEREMTNMDEELRRS